MNLDGFDEVTNMMNQLQELANKYPDCKRITPDKVKYRDPYDDELPESGKKVMDGKMILGIVGILAFLATTIFAFVKGELLVGFLSGFGTAFLIYFFLPAIFGKTKVATGKAVWKHWQYSSRSSGGFHASKNYFVYILMDEGGNEICQRVQTTEKDYHLIEEGTPVMIIKKGKIYSCAVR
ncbi:MAG: hypothetical protein K5745_02870 [Saccharofermentans sp.]|nr:hypothetical protein [Saccharofermentans sp.]